MSKLIKHTIIICTISISCVFLPSCKTFNFHQSEDDRWLIEQVEQGYLTQQEADQIKLENK